MNQFQRPSAQPAPRAVADYAPLARARLDPAVWDHFDSAAGAGITRRANREAWDALELWPRALRPLKGLHTSIELLGRRWPSPLLVAPMALQKLAHPDGELGMALAASAQGAGMVLSTQSSIAMEAITRSVLADAGRGPLWFQLYLQPERDRTLELVRRAEAAGFEALVLTVDAAVRAPHADLRLPPGIAAVHLPQRATTGLQGLLAQAATWDDLAWLLGATRLPVLLKGVLHPEDAREARRIGAGGVIVSNHAGRTLDTAVATARALPLVAEALDGKLPLLVDGGIERGTDVLKALALGADAVLVGRPALHGLAVAGAAGAAHVLRLLQDELVVAMAQCGLRDAAEAGLGLFAPPR